MTHERFSPDIESAELAELAKVQIAFGVATTKTEIDPDQRWDAIKLVSEYLGKLRLRASQPATPTGGESVAMAEASDLADKIEYAIKTEGEVTLFRTDGTRALYALRKLATPSAMAQSSEGEKSARDYEHGYNDGVEWATVHGRSSAGIASTPDREKVARAIHDGLGGDGWAYTNYGGDEWNDKRSALLDAADAAIALIAPAKSWECMGRKQSLPEPGECNWPDCGCDPHATKVIESLLEQGWGPNALAQPSWQPIIERLCKPESGHTIHDVVANYRAIRRDALAISSTESNTP